MAEWFKAHAWKVCVPSKVPWVRIPLSPPIFSQKTHFFDKKNKIEKKTKKHQKCIDFYSILTIKGFIDFIKKFKNVIINFSEKK